jgi:hypothetical protein
MAVYFFHLRDGADVLVDPDGRDLEDPDAIRAVALKEARALISAEVLEGRVDLSLRLDVEDGDHALVHRLVFADAIEIVHPMAG